MAQQVSALNVINNAGIVGVVANNWHKLGRSYINFFAINPTALAMEAINCCLLAAASMSLLISIHFTHVFIGDNSCVVDLTAVIKFSYFDWITH